MTGLVRARPNPWELIKRCLFEKAFLSHFKQNPFNFIIIFPALFPKRIHWSTSPPNNGSGSRVLAFRNQDHLPDPSLVNLILSDSRTFPPVEVFSLTCIFSPVWRQHFCSLFYILHTRDGLPCVYLVCDTRGEPFCYANLLTHKSQQHNKKNNKKIQLIFSSSCAFVAVNGDVEIFEVCIILHVNK